MNKALFSDSEGNDNENIHYNSSSSPAEPRTFTKKHEKSLVAALRGKMTSRAHVSWVSTQLYIDIYIAYMIELIFSNSI